MGVDLKTSTFTHSQLYVVLSRVTSIPKVTVLLLENDDGKTNNMIYPKVLLWLSQDYWAFILTQYYQAEYLY